MAPPERVIGCSTRDALRSGMYYGTLGSVWGLLKGIEQELGETPAKVATGGLAVRLAPSQLFDTIDEDLTLQGLRLFYEWRKAQ